ncbi:hypothetical protein [Pyrococcus abyssi]|uniref:hypothetical protein n=1 Tax=Pyrococcus abyssi TaxID=29292 RepID=UPI000B144323|nr:hypothetical protein [Pyrococcus abyssi]
MEVIKVEIPRELEEDVKRYIKLLKKRREVLKKTFGILKTEKTAKELKVEIYDELYD